MYSGGPHSGAQEIEAVARLEPIALHFLQGMPRNLEEPVLDDAPRELLRDWWLQGRKLGSVGM